MLGLTNERWDQVAKVYRGVLMERGVETLDDEGRVVKKGVKTAKLMEERERGYALAKSGLLRKRVRYFTDGVVLGGSEFLEKAFRKNKGRMKVKRERGARVPREEALRAGDVCVLVDLRSEQG